MRSWVIGCASLSAGVILAMSGCTAGDAIIAFSDPQVDGREKDSINRVSGNQIPAQGRAQVEALGTNTFRVRVTGLEDAYVSQSDIDICWAAAAEMIHRHEGRAFTQEQLAARYVNQSEKSGRAARPSQVIFALHPELAEDYLRDTSLKLFASPRAAVRTEDVLAWLSNGHAVVVGIDETAPDGQEYGHVYVLDGATYHEVNKHWLTYAQGSESAEDPWSQRAKLSRLYAISEVELLDPWQSKGRVSMSGKEFNEKVGFLLSRPEAEFNLRYLIEERRKSQQQNLQDGDNTLQKVLEDLF